jgi:flagellar basal-body rod protein FlgC
MQAMAISRTALDVEWQRLTLIAQNLANADSSARVNGGVYQSQTLVSGPKQSFGSYLDPTTQSGADLSSLAGVSVYSIDSDKAAPRLVHEPGNPNADKQGMVAYPSIDHASQMTLMIKTARAYEADIVAMNAAGRMYSKALELGKRA